MTTLNPREDREMAEARTDTNGFILNVTPDMPDVRDRMYEPALVRIPNEIRPEWSELNIRNQLREGACTGFALASAIDLLNARRGRGHVKVSARMLYEMAQKFDEWEGENYEGSSLRGAIRGWWHNGVCTEETWPYMTEDNREVLTVRRAKEARSNIIGAYYRLRPIVTDYHSALTETGVIVASARVHRGWFSPLDSEGRIVRGERIRDAGHAFAIVGYNSYGFYIQNSWDKDWGKDGVGIWTYEDWAENIMDAWVFHLALPEPRIFGLRPGSAGSRPGKREEWHRWLGGSTRRDEIAGHFVHIDDGQFHQTGPYHSREEDVRETAKQLVNSNRGYEHLLLYAHGGLNAPSDSATRVRAMKDVFRANKIYPFHFMYDSGLLEELNDIIFGKGDKAEERVGGFFDQIDRIIENRIRKIGTLIWEEMKHGTERAFDGVIKAGTTTLDVFARELVEKNIKVHLVGHSAGSIFIGNLLAATDSLPSWDLSFETCSLMAPACTVDFYDSHYKGRVGNGMSDGKTTINSFRIYNLTDELEQDDTVTPLYRKSLLYLVSNAFERTQPPVSKPILGMAKFAENVERNGSLEIIYAGQGSPSRSNSKTHSGFDNDVNTMNDVLRHILGREPERPFVPNDLNY